MSSGTPSIRLLAFAAARDVVGAGEVQFALAGECSVAEFWGRLAQRFPALGPHQRSIRLAINGHYVTDADRVVPGDEVAILPPVAGG